VVEGRGTAEIAGQRFSFGPRDTFVVPSWAPLRLSSPSEDTVLFSFSDRPVQQAMGILREAFLEDA
jgi:gentisate 1,2-dioxygenase